MSQNTDIGQGACITGNPTLNGNPLSAAAELLETVITLTSAQIKALTVSSSGILQIMPAPGAGKMYVIDFFDTNYQFGTTPYATGSGSIATGYYDGGTTPLSTTGMPAIASSALLNTNPVGSNFAHGIVTMNGLSAGNGVLTNTVNRPIGAWLASGSQYTTGDGQVLIRLRYRIVNAQ